MKFWEFTEAKVEPDWEFLADLEPAIDSALADYQEHLSNNNDKDDINELEELLNFETEDFPIEFITDYNDRKDPDEWISAVADWSEKEGKFITVYLHAKNLEVVYGPKTFKKILMRMLQHETIHWNQYDKMGGDVLNTYKSGFQRGIEKKKAGGTDADLMRSYLRDPHELMAYASDLADEMRDTDNPEGALRNPEAYKAQLPVWQRFRDTFPADAKQMKQLLKYTADYFKQGK